MRDVGRMGEDTFSLLCNSVGLSANRVQIDKTGWDFLVEFPEQSAQSIPLDMREGPFQCKFQIKATDKKVHGVSISLSNLNRLAKDPLPTFICLLGFNSKDKVQEIYCVHIDETIIEMTLKSIRKNESAGSTQLNKISMNVKFSEKTKLSNASGDELAAYVRSCIGKSIENYTKNKLNNLNRIGYSESRHGLRCTFDSYEELTKLEKSYLGLPTAININDVSGYTTRFGIELPDIAVKAEKAILQIHPIPLFGVIVKLQEDALSKPIIFNSTLFVSPSIKSSKIKARIVNCFFEFLIDFDSNTTGLDCKLDENTEATIGDFLSWFEFTKVINKKNVKLTIEPPGLPAMELIINSNNTSPNFPDCSDAHLLCLKILNIFRFFDINENKIGGCPR